MNHYTCDACHYIFKSESMPDRCPYCHSETTSGHSDQDRRFPLPALRPSTACEMEEYSRAAEAVSRHRDFHRRIESLSQYELEDDEYNLVLILLFFWKDAPTDLTVLRLDEIIRQQDPSRDGHLPKTDIEGLYVRARRHFTSELGRERNLVGDNDTITVASHTEKDSAANTLLQFRQSEQDRILDKIPNLGNIRKIRLERIAERPGRGYLHFLTDWYNSL